MTAARRAASPFWLSLSFLSALTYVASGLTGACAGLSAAAAGLVLDGQSILDVPATRAHVFLVVGPLLGLLPMSLLAFAAGRYADVARRVPAAFGIWAGCALLVACWFGLPPLLR